MLRSGKVDGRISALLRHWRESRATIISVLGFMSGQGVAAVLALSGGILQARYIEPGILGHFATFGILTSYLGILQAGWLTTLQREYPYWHGKRNPKRAARVLAVASGWAIVLVGATTVLFGILAVRSFVVGDREAAGG